MLNQKSKCIGSTSACHKLLSVKESCPPVKYFTDRSKAVLLLWIFYVMFCLVFAMSLCASVYMCFLVTCWERVDLLALVCGVLLCVCHFPIGILGQVWYLIVLIPDLCTLTYLL